MAILLRIFHRTFFESLIKTEASTPSSYLFSSSNPFASPLFRFISTNPLAHFSNNNTTHCKCLNVIICFINSFAATKELESGTVKKLIWEDYKRNHKGAIPPQVHIYMFCCNYLPLLYLPENQTKMQGDIHFILKR